MKAKVAILIGRFQPLHRGHLFAIKKALEVGEKVIVGIGSSQEEGTKDNPWSYEVRRKMVEVGVRELGIKEAVITIWPVPDFPSDREWTEEILRELKQVGVRKEEIVVVSNNEWTTRVLRGAGLKIYEQGYKNRGEWEGYKIREIRRRRGEEWRERVTEAIAKIMDENPVK